MFICYYNYDEQNLYRAISYNIIVNVDDKKLNLFKEGKLFKTYPIATGKTTTPTPKGDFKIINKASDPGGPFGARWLGLNVPGGDYGIHGTNNPSSIGKSVSNGCIRTYNRNIIELYNLVHVGTPVKIL